MYFFDVNYVFKKDEPHFVVWIVKPQKDSKKDEWVFDTKIYDKIGTIEKNWLIFRISPIEKNYIEDPKDLIKKVFNYENF